MAEMLPSILKEAVPDDLLLWQAAARLWSLVNSKGEILAHLAALRDYFFMGRGDFWQNFLLEVTTFLISAAHITSSVF